MGGDILATSIIKKINSIGNLKMNTGIVFAGSDTKRQLSGNLSNGGWSSLIEENQLDVKIFSTDHVEEEIMLNSSLFPDANLGIEINLNKRTYEEYKQGKICESIMT